MTRSLVMLVCMAVMLMLGVSCVHVHADQSSMQPASAAQELEWIQPTFIEAETEAGDGGAGVDPSSLLPEKVVPFSRLLPNGSSSCSVGKRSGWCVASAQYCGSNPPKGLINDRVDKDLNGNNLCVESYKSPGNNVYTHQFFCCLPRKAGNPIHVGAPVPKPGQKTTAVTSNPKWTQ
jgi:hypothetical protein